MDMVWVDLADTGLEVMEDTAGTVDMVATTDMADTASDTAVDTAVDTVDSAVDTAVDMAVDLVDLADSVSDEFIKALPLLYVVNLIDFPP